MSKKTANVGDKVSVHYIGKLKDTLVEFDNSYKRGNPLEFVIAGEGTPMTMIKGFNNGVVGMEVGEEKTINIPFTEGYGERREDAVAEIPKENFGASIENLTIGGTVQLGNPQGQKFMGTIVEMVEDKVKVDMNPPLAGKDLIFNVKLVNIS